MNFRFFHPRFPHPQKELNELPLQMLQVPRTNTLCFVCSTAPKDQTINPQLTPPYFITPLNCTTMPSSSHV